MKNTVWVLTSEYNDYDQHGEYFVEVFRGKPTEDQIADVVGFYADSPTVQHILSGGGREKYEDVWFNLKEVKLQ